MNRQYTPIPVAPSAPEMEMAVLGCCQYYPTAYAAAAAMIGDRPVFFEKPSAHLWEVLRRWYADHPDSPPDDMWIVHELITIEGMNLFAVECRVKPCLSPNIELHTAELLRLYRLRRSRDLAGLLARAIDRGDVETVEAVRRDLAELDIVETISNPVVSAAEMMQNPPEPERILIHGLLARGGIWCISASSKAGKSCLCLQAALCLASGSNLLGQPCAPSKVLIVDLETTPGLFHAKLQAAITQGTAAGWLPPHKDYLNNIRILAGNPDAYTLEGIQRIIRNEPPADAFIVDPIYLIGAQSTDADENSATATTRLLTGLKTAADTLGASLIYTHHHAKGNQSQRDFWDRAAGSGVHARMAYAMSSLTPTDDGGVLLESLTRGFKMPEPLPLTFTWPCFEIAENGSTKLKGAAGRPGSDIDLAAYAIEHGQHIKAFHTSVSLKDAAGHFNVSEKTVRRHAAEQKIPVENGFLHLENATENGGENDAEVPF